jgi:hypothetical protein
LPSCPMSPPETGDACPAPGFDCVYRDELCGGIFMAVCTRESVWVVEQHGHCGTPECPHEKPMAGEECRGWSMYTCGPYPAAEPCPELEAWATCDGVWAVSEPCARRDPSE